MTISLVGFRAYRAQVQQLLAAAGHNPRVLSDRAVIDAWLGEETAAALVQRFLDMTCGTAQEAPP